MRVLYPLDVVCRRRHVIVLMRVIFRGWCLEE